MSNPDESAFTFLPLGGIIQEFRVAGHNIVQGFPTAEDYVKHNSPYFGATIGRTCNRLKDAVLTNVNGRSYELAKNNGPNSLHGGKEGWDKRLFDGPKAVNRNGKEGIRFKYLSKDGEEGYPGTVELRVWYTASKEDGKTVLEVEYEVEFVGDEAEETAVSVTNHRSVVSCCRILFVSVYEADHNLCSYFNLSDGPTIAGTQAQLYTDKYLPVDTTGIPHGTIESFTHTNVTSPFVLGPTDPDIDDCFVVETDPSKVPLDTRGQPLNRLASFSHPATNLHLEVYSTEPAFQFYTGKYIDVPMVDGAPARGPRAGFCVEPSRYVNAPNQPEWRQMTLLKRGQIWGAKNVYKAWKE
jgi:aldose 1-epimerase